MRVSTTELFRHAYGKYAIGGYNITNLEQLVGLFRGNLGKREKNDEPVDPAVAAPFILQISRGAWRYTDRRFLEAIIRTAEEVFPEAIFAVHLDHGTEEVCYDAIDSGIYTSVMIDASDKPFEENVAITRRVVERAHAKGVVVEAELGQPGGVEEDVLGMAPLTDPDQAAEFVERTGCDSLAVLLCYSHGAYKFSPPKLGLDWLEKIQQHLPKGYPLVMHGGSSLPREWVQRINAAGGQIKGSSGVPEEDYLKAAKLGLCKINIDTDGRLVWCAIYRESFRDNPADFDPRTPGKRFMREYASYIIHKNQMLGSAGQLEAVRQYLTQSTYSAD